MRHDTIRYNTTRALATGGGENSLNADPRYKEAAHLANAVAVPIEAFHKTPIPSNSNPLFKAF